MTEANKKNTAKALGVGSIGALIYSINPDWVSSFLNEALQLQVTQFGIAFTLAAWIHAGRVKKEIKFQVEAMTSAMTEAINNVAVTLRQDLSAHAERITRVEDIVFKNTGVMKASAKKGDKHGLT